MVQADVGTTVPDEITKPDKKKDLTIMDEQLSEEDQILKADLETLVSKLKGLNMEASKSVLDQLKIHIRTSTSSMTAVPKPLKFLRPHYHELQDMYQKWPSASVKNEFADVLSVLAMTYSDNGKRECLKFRLSGSMEDPGLWGHEYIRHLATELGEERTARLEKEVDIKDLMTLAVSIVSFFLNHNAEADAVDLLLELEAIEQLPPLVDENTYSKVCLYMINCVSLLPPPEDLSFLRTAHQIYRIHKQLPQAMLLAIRLDDHELIKEVFDGAEDVDVKRQMAYMIARQQIWLDDEDDGVAECLRNSRLSEHFKSLGKELSLLEPKLPEDIYKTHLESTRSGLSTGSIDSAKQNLASTFVNAFVNAGYGNDKLMLLEDESSSWIYKNKDSGMTSATASIGLLMLWDVEGGLGQIDKYLYSSDENITAGALLAIGLINNGVHNESDPAMALLSEYIEKDSVKLKTNAIIGLGIAYAGSNKQEVMDLLIGIVADTGVSMEISSLAALSLGLIFVGSCNGEITSTILQTLMEREENLMSDKWARFMTLGLALLFLGKQEDADATLETLKAIDNPIAKDAEVLVDILSYTGTGNVLKIQSLLHLCNDHIEKSDDKEQENLFQGFAVLGIALIAMGEDIGSEMVLRQFSHLMHYGEPVIRRAVPLALGLLSASNPQIKVFETLSRYSHDNNLDVAINAIFAMGMVGAGTNNARLAQLLRQLASYYSREPNCLFMVRIAQGLLHMGKGTMSINPYHDDRSVVSYVGLSGLLIVLVSMLDSKSFILDQSHWMLFYLVNAMHPRMLITVDTNGNFVPISVRVGQAVDSFGPGKPRKITGWVTQTTPVLLHYEQRAELATQEYIPLSSVLEGMVIVKKNENYEDDT